ncbi:MAG: ribonuclease III [Clostridiales bacterium]|nr:ribonuclease III [Clostridiales bacterium]
MRDAGISELEQKLQYTFRNVSLLETALTHSSWANERRGRCQCNERLEFLGDSVLGMTVAEHLYRTFPDMPEGRMTRLRAELVCEQSLHQVALGLGLGAYIRLGKGEEHTGGHERPSILADAVEAVIAALYLDGGLAPARAFVHRRVLTDVTAHLSGSSMDYKTRLQELVQQKSGQTLAYEMVGASGADHSKVFTARVSLNGEPVGEGSGRTKKEAEQMAAKSALERLSR